MEELGTEIVLQPGMATNLLQSCVTEQAEEITQEVLPSPCSETGDVEQEEPSPTTEVAYTEERKTEVAYTEEPTTEVAYTEEPSTEEEEREESSTPRALEEQPQEQPSRPEVNRYDSLIETESVLEQDEEFVSDVRDESPEMNEESFEPQPVDNSEGQEAVWHEDVEYSTNSSVCYVKPEKEKKARRRIKLSFFNRGKKAQKAKPVPATTEVAKEPRPVPIHNEGEQEVGQYEKAIELERVRTNFAKISMDEDDNDEDEGAAYSNAIDLTDAPNTTGMADAPNDVERAQPTEASNTVESTDESDPKELNDAPMELAADAPNSIEITSTIDGTMIDDETATQENIVADIANRAMNYIESILPMPKRGSSDDESISTLGLKNDTEEYDLDTATYDDETYDRSKITDMVSLSSLNDILDGNGSVADKKRSKVEKYAVLGEEKEGPKEADPSPPTDVEETELPKEDVEETELPKEENPELSQTNPEQEAPVDSAAVTPEIEESSAAFKNTLCVSVDVPTQLNLVVDDRYDPAHVDEQSNAERSERSDRYTMVEQKDDDVKVELTTTVAKADESGGLDDDEMSEDFNRLQSASFDQMCDDIVYGRTESSPTNVDKSEEDDNKDRYEPVAETPSRGGVELEESNDTEIDMCEKETKEEDMMLTNEEPGDEKSEHEEVLVIATSNDESPRDCEAPINQEAQVKDVVETKNDEMENVEKAIEEKQIVEEEAVEQEIVETEEKSNVIEQTKRKPLVPKAVVEEEYLVDKKMKKISSGKTPSNKSSWIKKTKNKRRSLTSKRTAAQRAVSEVKKNAAPAPAPAVFDDSSTVVHQAMSNGALKANESNLEGDDFAPTNYLSAALKKQKARYDDMGKVVDDDDSYVAAIRGPQTKEAPGVALVDEKKHLEPGIESADNEVAIDLAPTPRLARKPNMFTNEEKLAEEKALAIAKEREEERQRRKLITERLFNAGRSNEVTKESTEDVLKTISTAPTSESYSEEPVSEDAEKKDTNEKVKPVRRKLAISFLKRK